MTKGTSARTGQAGPGVAGRVPGPGVVDVVLPQQPVEQRDELVEAVNALTNREVLAEDARVEGSTGPQPAPEPATADGMQPEHVPGELVHGWR